MLIHVLTRSSKHESHVKLHDLSISYKCISTDLFICFFCFSVQEMKVLTGVVSSTV